MKPIHFSSHAWRMAAVLAISSIAIAGPALAVPRTDGFFLGLDIQSSHIGTVDRTDNDPAGSVFVDQDGGGANLYFGYGITESFPLRLALNGAEHKTDDPGTEFTIGSVTLEGAYLFRVGQVVRPYLFGGLGGYAIESRKGGLKFETTGPGVVVGAGLLYFIGDHFAFDFALRGDFINWDESRAEIQLPGGTVGVVTTPVEDEGSAAKFMVGGSVWF